MSSSVELALVLPSPSPLYKCVRICSSIYVGVCEAGQMNKIKLREGCPIVYQTRLPSGYTIIPLRLRIARLWCSLHSLLTPDTLLLSKSFWVGILLKLTQCCAETLSHFLQILCAYLSVL